MHKFLRIEAQKTKGSLDLKYKKNSIFGLLTLIFFICSTKPKLFFLGLVILFWLTIPIELKKKKNLFRSTATF